MRVHRTHTIDIELANKLSSEVNASQLINSLLEAHYSVHGKDLDELNEELDKEISEKVASDLKLKEYQEKKQKHTDSLRDILTEEIDRQETGLIA